MPLPMKGETIFPGAPPRRCECGCGRAITTSFVDGRLRNGGAWGYFASECFARLGVGLGTGRGQQWRRNSAGQFALVKMTTEAV